MDAIVTEEKIGELTRRIAEAVKPERIILFGSAARGQLGPHSDLDVLVVVRDGVHRGHTAEEIYRRLWGFGIAKDIVVVTDSDVERYKDSPFTVIKRALEEGKELYRAA